jgi:flagellar biosynthesis protein FlhG
LNDQATTLRGLTAAVHGRPRATPAASCETIAVPSGKGGLGKSTLTLNTGIALTRAGYKVLIVDADIGTANIDILVNIDSRTHLGHVVEGKAHLNQVVRKITGDLFLIPGASGIAEIGNMSLTTRQKLREDLVALEKNFDYLIVDTSAGVSNQVIRTLRGTDRILLVCSGEPTSIVDAYALCKVLFQQDPHVKVELVINNIADKDEADDVYGKLNTAVNHFLKRELHYLSYVVNDAALAQGVSNQEPIMMTHPDAGGAAAGFKTLAEKLAHPSGWSQGRGVEHLFNQLLDN